jgi:20S proteasome alpha/beta subunit
MTVTIGFLCSDGVVVGVDSMLTPSMGNIPTGHHKGRKLHILSGHQICGIAGDFGLAARFRIMAEANAAQIGRCQHPLDFGLFMAGSMATQFQNSGLGNTQIDLGTVLGPKLINLDAEARQF